MRHFAASLAFRALIGAAAVTAVATATADTSPGAYTLITLPDQGYARIYDFILSAKKTLDMTMYELNDTTAEQALAEDARNGVRVRVILDRNLQHSHNQDAYDYLSQNGVSVVWANPDYAATHQKTITVDGTTSAILTGNLSSRDYATSRDFAVIDANANDVDAIEQVFDADFTGNGITPNDGDTLVWSPTDAEDQLLHLIHSATTSLQVENEEMAYKPVTTALRRAAKRGVDVQVIMTHTGDAYAREFDALTSAGVQVSTYDPSAPLYIHAKVILVDYGTSSARVFIGSENFSSSSLTRNRELGLIVTDSSILDSVNSTLSSDFHGGTRWNSRFTRAPRDAPAPFRLQPAD